MTAAEEILRSPLRVLTYRTLIPARGDRHADRRGYTTRPERSRLRVRRAHGAAQQVRQVPRVPLHTPPSTPSAAISGGATDCFHGPRRRALFISTAGTRLLYCNVQWTFRRLVRNVGLQPRSTACRPRLHDLRHSFAVRTSIDAYRADIDVAARLPLLSTYLGHVHPAIPTGIYPPRQSCCPGRQTPGAQPRGAV